MFKKHDFEIVILFVIQGNGYVSNVLLLYFILLFPIDWRPRAKLICLRNKIE